MDTKALQQKILDLAIRGKLVPQDPNDEPASVLLERIREQKQQMVKEGKLKKKDIKNDSVIFVGEDNLHYEKFQDGTVKCIEDEIPFELPEGWSWCRLLSLSIKIGAGSTPTGGAAVYTTSGIKFIRSQNVYDDGLVLDDVAYIPEEINQKKSGSIVKSKDILLNITGGSIGRCALVSDDFDIANVNQHVMIIRLANLELRKYIHSVVISPYIQEQIISRQVGSGRGGLSAETLSTFLIPLPPLNEQVSINRKLNECISQVLAIADAKCNISNLIIATKAKILDLAIRGKLVPQDPNDEPASVLLERIRAEKEELIKQGKIKRDKKKSVIFKGDDNSYYERVGDIISNIDDEIPFEVPQNWEWSRLQTICYPITDGTHKTPTYSDSGYIFLSAKNITTGKINWNDIMYIPKSLHDELYSRVSPKMNDILLAKNGTTGVAAIVDRECEFDIYVTLALLRVINNNISSQYLLKIIASNTIQDYFKSSLKGIGVPNLHLEHIRTTLIPIPPINEQNKIVEKIYQYYSLLDSIVQNIE